MDRDAPHAGGHRDAAIRAANEAAGKKLCPTCDGTGNWLYSMYQQCAICGGSGRFEDILIPEEEI